MKYGSVCSGIEAATVAWHELGWQPAWFSEIEKFPSQVLAHHYPNVKNLGDMTFIAEKIRNSEIEAPEVLVGGTPCQAFSVAGLRNSLDDDRGQLSLEFVRLANEIDSARFIRGQQPSIIVWENVPGVLSTKDNAFGCFLGALSGEGCELKPTGKKWTNTGCVFGPQRQIAWRVLDAQHFGLAQRRKRVFVVASARTESITEILFERKGMYRDSTQSRGKTENTTRCGEIHTNRASTSISGKTYTPPIISCDIAHCLGRNSGQENVLCESAYAMIADTTPKVSKEINGTLRSSGGGGIVPSSVIFMSIARYLTEIECERLQGFPDNYTNIPKASATARYKSLGNSMAVPVMRWIGRRIQQYCEVV